MIKAIKRETNKQMRQKCEICDSKFQMLVNIEHLCKRCHRYICQKCTPKRIKIFQAQGHSSTHKCCSICIREQDIISNYLIKYRLVFGQNSIFADEWFKKMNKQKTSYNDILNQYNQKIFGTNSNIIRFKSESNTIFNELCAGQNYSMRQFTGKLIDEIDDQTIKQKVSNTIISIYAYLKQIPFNYELVYLVTFMLCFCNEMNCYFIITRFIQKVFPQYFKIQKVQKDNILNHELKMIIDMYKVLVKKIQKQELDKILKYLEKKFTTFTNSFLVNVTNVSVSFYLIDQMLKNSSYIYLYKAISSILFLSRQVLYQQREQNLIQAIETFALKNIEIDQIKLSMINFEKSSAKFEMDHQFFDSAEHRKLYEKYKQLENMYQKSQETSRSFDSKYNSLLKKYDKLNLMYAQQSKKVLSLQEQLLGIADKLILIQDIQKFQQENKLILKKNTFLTEQSSRLKKQLQDMKKKQFLFNSEKFIFEKVKEDYNRQIVDLKTKNQLYEIEKMINNQIDFNTSVIQERITAKNLKIAQLQKANNQMLMEIQFYRKSRPTQGRSENPFNINVSMIHKANFEQSKTFGNGNSLNLSSIQISSKEEKDQFKKYLQTSKQITQKLKSQLSESHSKIASLQKQIKRLQETARKLKSSLDLNQQINIFINQIPQEISYTQKIQQLQRLISKEANIHKKSQLQEILSSFKKCIFEVRYRTIDAKLKERKLAQILTKKDGKQIQKIIDLMHEVKQEKQKEKEKEEELKIESDENIAQLQQILGWMGKEQQIVGVNRSSIKREECLVM